MSTGSPESPRSYDDDEKQCAAIVATGRLHFMLPMLAWEQCWGCSAFIEATENNNEGMCDALMRSRGMCTGTGTVFVRASDIDRYRIEAVTRKLKA